MTLQEAFSEIKDPRRAQGQRVNLEQMLTIIFISNLCGHFGGRGISRFAKIHAETFSKELNLKHAIPSHVTFSDLINRIDQQELINVFNKWAGDFVPLEKGDEVSGDGKALGSTVTDSRSHKQNFQAVVSMFCQKSGLVHSLETYSNAKESEINIVRFLIDKLKDMGITLFLDALHTQKKR